MINRRDFIKRTSIATGFTLSGLGSMAIAQENGTLKWSVHVDLTGPASYGGIPRRRRLRAIRAVEKRERRESGAG